MRLEQMTRFVRLAMAAALCLVPAAVRAHGALRSSTPPAGAQLRSAPTEIRLTFNEAVVAGASRIALLGPSGPRTLGQARVRDQEPKVLVVAVDGPWTSGEHTVRWQIAGKDGHPVRGEFAFTILPEAIPAMPSPVDTPSTDVAAAAPESPATPGDPGEVGSPAFVAIRWLTFGAILVSLGVVVFGAIVARVLVQPAAQDAWARASRLGIWAALGALALAAIRLNAQVRAFGGHLGDLGLLRGLTVGTAWGAGLMLQCFGAGVLVYTFRRVRPIAGPQVVAFVGVLVLALSPALSGHAAAEGTVAVLLDWAHVIGAGGWLGTLLILLAAGVPATRSLSMEAQAPAVKDLVVRFSRVALCFAGVAALTGAVASWRNLGTWEGLLASPYGRLLLIKLAILSVVGATGAWNWRVVTPRLGTPAGTAQLRRTATFEFAGAVAGLLGRAVRVATPPPMEPSAMAAVDGAGGRR